MQKIREFLQGKKTYLVSAMAVITALLALISGQASFFETFDLIVIALGLGTLRAGVTTEAQK